MALTDERKAKMAEGRAKAQAERQAEIDRMMEGKTPEEQELIRLQLRKEAIAKQMAAIKSRERSVMAARAKKAEGSLLAYGDVAMRYYRVIIDGGANAFRESISLAIKVVAGDKSKEGQAVASKLRDYLTFLGVDMAVPLPAIKNCVVPYVSSQKYRLENSDAVRKAGLEGSTSDDGKVIYLEVPAGTDLRVLDEVPYYIRDGFDWLEAAGPHNRHGF